MQTAMTAQLWIPGPLPGLNEMIAAAKGAGGRGIAYSRMKRQWTDTVWALAKSNGLPSFQRTVSFVFEWREASRRRDPDNVAAAGRKLILDGLVKAGVLPGDGWNSVVAWTDKFTLVGALGPPGCLVTMDGA